MPIRDTDIRFNIQDDQDFIIDIVDKHIEEYPKDFKSRSDFYRQASRFLIGSRRNKGKLKIIKLS